MTRFHIVTDASTAPPTISQVPYTAQEEAAADSADAAAQTEAARQTSLGTDAGVQQLIAQLKTANASQIDTWLVSNVTNLAQARTVLGYVIKLLAVSIRNQLG